MRKFVKRWLAQLLNQHFRWTFQFCFRKRGHFHSLELCILYYNVIESLFFFLLIAHRYSWEDHTVVCIWSCTESVLQQAGYFYRQIWIPASRFPDFGKCYRFVLYHVVITSYLASYLTTQVSEPAFCKYDNLHTCIQIYGLYQGYYLDFGVELKSMFFRISWKYLLGLSALSRLSQRSQSMFFSCPVAQWLTLASCQGGQGSIPCDGQDSFHSFVGADSNSMTCCLLKWKTWPKLCKGKT